MANTKTTGAAVTAPKKRVISREDMVVVISGCPNRLVYTSPRNGYTIVWPEFGDEQKLSVDDLLDAKRLFPRYFSNNWFVIYDKEVLDYLGVARFFDNSIGIETFDSVFQKDPDDVEKIIKTMNDGQKEILIVRTRTMIKDGRLDSISLIKALSKALNEEFVLE